MKDLLNWLQDNIDPWNEVRDKWCQTAAFRIEHIRKDPKKYNEIGEYFSTYKALLEPQGYTLVSATHMYYRQDQPPFPLEP